MDAAKNGQVTKTNLTNKKVISGHGRGKKE